MSQDENTQEKKFSIQGEIIAIKLGKPDAGGNVCKIAVQRPEEDSYALTAYDEKAVAVYRDFGVGDLVEVTGVIEPHLNRAPEFEVGEIATITELGEADTFSYTGRVTEKGAVTKTKAGGKYCRFTLKQDGSDPLDMSALREDAPKVSEEIGMGDLVHVEGTIKAKKGDRNPAVRFYNFAAIDAVKIEGPQVAAADDDIPF